MGRPAAATGLGDADQSGNQETCDRFQSQEYEGKPQERTRQNITLEKPQMRARPSLFETGNSHSRQRRLFVFYSTRFPGQR